MIDHRYSLVLTIDSVFGFAFVLLVASLLLLLSNVLFLHLALNLNVLKVLTGLVKLALASVPAENIATHTTRETHKTT